MATDKSDKPEKTEKAEKPDARQWFLRIAGGTVFGPVSTRGLTVWAEQGRVLPGNEVSSDRTHWQAADSLAELAMTWYLEDPGGSLVGPFNRAAAETLIREGRSAAGARVVAAAEADLSRLRRTADPAAKRGPERGDHPELELAQQDAAPAASMAAEPPAEWQEEREGLRLRISELETKLQQVVRNADKDVRGHERQKEGLRKTIAQLQRELEDARTHQPPPATENGEAGGDPATSADAVRLAALEEAIEEAQRGFADERRLLEREADALRARIAELEAAATSAPTATAAAPEPAPDAPIALTAELQSTREALAASRCEQATADQDHAAARAKLHARLAEQEACKVGLEAQLARQAIELAELTDARDRLATAQIAADQQQATLDELRAALAVQRAAWESQQAELDAARQAAQEQTAAQAADSHALQERLTRCEHELAAERAEFAETLVAANTRDSEYEQQLAALQQRAENAETAGERQAALAAELAAARERIAALEAQVAQAAAIPPPEPGVVREAAARLREGEDLLRGVLSEEIAALDLNLEAERDAFLTLRDTSLKRQELLQARLAALRSLQGGETEGVIARQVQSRAAAAEPVRLRDELESLRTTHQRHVRQAEERERELARRVRVLESDEARIKGQLGESDALHRRLQDLTETVRQREQDLAQERRLRTIEQEQFQQAQQGLLRRIEGLERAEDGRAPGSPPAAAPQPAPDEAVEKSSGRTGFRATPWMRLKR